MRVIDAAPHWVQTELRRMMADRVMSGLSYSKDDELRRVREALDWMSLPLPGVLDGGPRG